MLPAATREEQAMACLEAAEHYREPLLALANKLTGSAEEGMNLYQQTLLNCHDAIQRNGFAGDKYQFYLVTCLRNLCKKQQQRGAREVKVDFQALESGSSGRDDEGSAPWAAKAHRLNAGIEQADLVAHAADAHAQLAEQIQAEVRTQFSYADRIALRLSLDGLSCQQIAEHIGTKDQSWVNRRLKRMKEQLRQTFQQAWEALSESDY